MKTSRSENLNDGLLHECIALTTLSHPRIVKVLGLLLNTTKPAMLLEFLDGGSLERYERAVAMLRPPFTSKCCVWRVASFTKRGAKCLTRSELSFRIR